MVEDVLHRPLLAALLQALSVQLVLLLQQRVQHALHLPGGHRVSWETRPTLWAKGTALGWETKNPVLARPA